MKRRFSAISERVWFCGVVVFGAAAKIQKKKREVYFILLFNFLIFYITCYTKAVEKKK